MLTTKEKQPAMRALRGWAISVLQETGAIRECEEHGWVQDRTDPHARERALDIARHDPPVGLSSLEALAGLRDGWIRSGIPVRIVRPRTSDVATRRRRRGG